MIEIVPPHLTPGMELLQDPKQTLEQNNLDIGGYIRISTPKDSQLTSIENQKKLLREWAEVNRYNLVRFYTDIKSGAYVHLRNEINELLDDIRNKKIRGIVTKEISRTSRDVMDILELKRTIAAYGGFFIAIKESYDSRTDDDEFLLILHGALAQKERKTTASRVKVTQLIKAREGKTNVPHPAFGYMLSEDRQHLVPNPETAPIYRWIVERFLEGWGQLKIAKALNAQGIPSKRGQTWSTHAVKCILKNPVYLGITIYNTTALVRDPLGHPKRVVRPHDEWIIREHTHEPLITEEEFNRIQEILRHRTEYHPRAWTCDRKYLGSTILRCADCGGKIYGTRYQKRLNGKKVPNEYYYRYVCQARNGKCSPPIKYWNMQKVDFIIMELFRSIFSDRKKLFAAVQEQAQIFVNKDDPEVIKQRDALTARIASLDRAMKKQQVAYEQDVINIEEYRQRLAELREEKQSCMRKLSSLNEKLNRREEVIERLNRIYRRVVDKLDHIHELPLAEKIGLVSAAFESIYLRADYSIAEVVFKLR